MGGKEKGDANDLSGLFIINYHYLNLKERERECGRKATRG
jgi:hypothetical protein